ncbi:MAG: hypothetical protein GXO49_04590 [Chlorobi bacterium]|nr:hypothetical protein [Chlorobiota bacterium]
MNTLISNINLQEPELRHILTEVKNITGFDFSLYSYGFIKRRTEYFMFKNNVFLETELIYRLNNSLNFAGAFVNNVFFQQYELFRDAEAWNYIDEKILPKLLKKSEIKIYFPFSSGTEDIYSFLFLLNRYKNENFHIFITGVTDKHILEIKKAVFSKNHVKASEKNIGLFNFTLDKDDVFISANENYKVKKEFKGTLHFNTCDFFKNQYLSEFDLVFFRNKMIFFNEELKAKALNFVVRSLKKGAYLILGEKERINTSAEKKIKQLHKGLSIYKRKTFSLS